MAGPVGRGPSTQFRPNVVMVLAGRWEVMDRLVDGRWSHIGEPAFDAAVRQSLEGGRAGGEARAGPTSCCLTAPCFDSGEQASGLPWPEDDPVRLARYNQFVFRSRLSTRPPSGSSTATAMVCPGGESTPPTVDGVQLRDGDGVHIVPTPAPPPAHWLAAPFFLPPVHREVQTGSRCPGAAWKNPHPPQASTPPDGVGSPGPCPTSAARGP